ncbi:helix-turn-helix domain-containing protein [Planctomicrobium sp. SH668]|uniref:PAS domain-containing protein n=1 Tax=Planctomicrobium sp. SH668 TaxID=3448126 RepID=UPI003F5AF5FB
MSFSTAREILGMLDTPFTGEPLFDCLSDIVYFIKDAKCRYVVVNKTLVERCGFSSKAQLIGKTAGETQRAPLGPGFEDQDRAVLQTGVPLIAKLELHIYPSRDVGWCLTHKLPLRNADGDIVGIVGMSQDLRMVDANHNEYKHVAVAVAYAESNLSPPPTIAKLAEIAEMSPYQLDRRMRNVFGLTTGQWLLKLRIDLAQRLLRTTEESIAQISLLAGYSDQSAFTRQFRRATGLSPSDYRKGVPIP